MGILSDIVNEDKVEMCPEACCGKPITECKCGPDCEHCDCHSKNAINEGTQGCADCEWIKDETDGDITTCDECAAEKREKTNESEKRWKQTSMSPQEAIAKYGKENVKVKKGALRNGDDMVEVFVEGYKIRDKDRGYGVADATYKTRKAAQDAATMKAASNGGDWEVIEEMNDDAVKKAIMSSGKEPQDALYDLMSVDGPLGDYVRRSYEITAGENGLHGDDDHEEIFDKMVYDLGLDESYSPGDEYADSEGMVSNCCGAPMYDYDDGHGRCSDCHDMAAGETDEEYYESGISRLKELSGIAEAPTGAISGFAPQYRKPKDITNTDDALIHKGSTRGVNDPFDASGTGHADGHGWTQAELDAADSGFQSALDGQNQIQINRYLADLPLDIAKNISKKYNYGTVTGDDGNRYNPSYDGEYDHVKNPNYGTDAMDPETIAKIKDPDWRNTYDMKDPKFKNIRPTEATNEAEIPEPEFQIMKKSLLRAKWYLENEEMDPEMVSSELRDVNDMIDAVNRGESEAPFDLDTSVEEEYMSLYNQCVAKLRGAVSNIYGVDHDVLPLDAKPNPESPYNSGQVEENISLEDDSELQRILSLANHGIKKAPIEENFVDDMPHGLLDGMTFTDGNPDYDYRGNPMNYGEVDWPEINDRHKDENGNVRPEATIKPEDFAVDDLLPG